MADKHTSGPWEVFTAVDEPQMGNFHSAIYGPAGDYDGLFVALANQNGNYEADARLIAAAPDLLDACRALLGFGDKHEGMTFSERTELAAAAIAKAEGRS